MTPPGITLEVQVGRKKADPPDEDKTPRKRARDRGTVTPLGVEVETAIMEALGKFMAGGKLRPTKKSAIEYLLTRALQAEGYWPPPPG